MKMAADPWLTDESEKDCNVTPQNNAFEDNFKPFEKLPDSASYLSSLELKLSKLQGKHKEPKSGDVVHGLEIARGQHMRSFVADNEFVSIDVFDDVAPRAIAPAFVVRKLCPERQAMSAEELQHLLTADELEKMAAELREASSSKSTEPDADTASQ